MLFLPTKNIYTNEDEQTQVRNINNAILDLKHGKPGPTHINLYTTYSRDFSVKQLPDCRKINRILDTDVFPEMNYQKIGIFIGNQKNTYIS